MNAGFYCFDFEFLNKYINKIPRSELTGEYYLNSLIKMAVKAGKRVFALKVLFEDIGLGVNTLEELKESEKIYLKVR